MSDPTASGPVAATAEVLNGADKAQLASLFAEMRKQMQAEFQVQLNDAIAALRPDLIQQIAVDVNAAFAANNPGIGGAPPLVHEVLGVTEDAVGELSLSLLHALVGKVSNKLDALVQATGHGNSAAMALHL